MSHPLTDEICADISPKRSFGKVLGEVRYCNDMRAGADWQLEQVIDWIERYLDAGDVIADSLKTAMRPQEDK